MSNPRIISGTARGIRIHPVPGDITRPITDRVKESLFNILGSDIIDSNFLDLFGGTGSVGIEALSRGAASCTFVDIHPKAVSTIKSNLISTKLEKAAAVIQGDAIRYVNNFREKPFEYVYIAPPQYKEIWKDALLLVDKTISLITDDAWVIVQIHPIEYQKLDLSNLIEFDQRKYGSTLLVFYENILETNPR